MKQPVEGAGDVWTWTALDSDSKLIVSWLVGGRDGEYALAFMDDVKDRLANRVQLTTDGHRAYLNAIEEAFGADIDYAMLVKQYGEPESNKSPERRYSPAVCTGAVTTRVEGNPDPEHVSTSHIERANLTMRMANRRFTRLTNAFSKKFENHVHMVAIYTVWYNQNAQDAENDAGNGRWRVQDALVDGRPLREDGRSCAEARQAGPLQKVSGRNFKLRHYQIVCKRSMRAPAHR
ncbi:DDE domain-containing protein [Mesorhizobium sp. M4B.F.Ca.ET.215.01.1.1]|nr:DDE domain-containing protein [Mesorhizobium sp. M4B.F.Ca.ET.013.02.1.1]RVD34092.1 DDE domain-containing protein [Mesorhizobium sp. M4B.F.Ca.ET.019.03.1.1]RWF63551.1 MAG: DDE domain-containing protein [Mesorhizobium sp.]TGQ18298.1 DDE domain-containing protein [Mesorhizobium sp. M4B.F.Ca.ET.215.01.1.1]TGQ27267.1 DDE domain-containing protein [Mesorhizobium sp. M00.F.Ca.ET.220.01.1.1]TGQ97014.1 DDE domain-containing protein [Mesorhizobium sp. M4B.F.Ca.ET.203.01.1.1]TGR00286.1 DDE domain-con